MARTPIVAGNWKMNTNAAAARELIGAIRAGGIDDVADVETIVCPPFVYLPLVQDAARGSSLKIGGQDVFWEEKGAYTGEVSPAMLAEFAQYALIGHSERRAYFGETDESVNHKLRAVIAAGLLPILCVGETGEERNAGHTEAVLRRQIEGALDGLSLHERCVIAYEPVWAIGTGVAATVADANLAIGFIRAQVARLQGEGVARALRILYGGSVTPANIAEFVAQPEVDGGLVGGASLQASSFLDMVKAVAALKLG